MATDRECDYIDAAFSELTTAPTSLLERMELDKLFDEWENGEFTIPNSIEYGQFGDYLLGQAVKRNLQNRNKVRILAHAAILSGESDA